MEMAQQFPPAKTRLLNPRCTASDKRRGPTAAVMWMDTKTEVEEASRNHASRSRRVMSGLLLFTGDMEHLDKCMQDKLFVLQLAVWGLRGVARVILANNPLSGALILAALYWASPWQGLLGTLGVLASTLTAVIIGQDSAEVSGGLHGFNGMLVSLLIGVFSTAGDWYWWLLLPVCLGSATWLRVASFWAWVRSLPVELWGPHSSSWVLFCSTLPCWPPMLCWDRQWERWLVYPWRCDMNLCTQACRGLMERWAAWLLEDSSSPSAGGLTSLPSPAVGLPACSWAATLTATLMLLLTGSLAAYRIPIGQVMAPEHNLRSRSQWEAGNTADRECTDV
ncbi:uncharacterized protein LOC116385485 isoform X4 [Anarrhichthys ocellatus]|uniref:uncharacterized protein LOC116385485 isoform X4 n=1 Tax=Anarrhichthys ocellatus TaxID=433405 RepID=UPI0012ECBCAE|nr:uncharacterized protein LOC116385485 isoform X4 [Anarrhichthys ocellatus]